MLPWGSRAGSVSSAWRSQPMAQAKNAESPASMRCSRKARGYVRTTVSAE